MNKIIFAIVGAILGIPLSYYLQSDMYILGGGGFFDYLANIVSVFEVRRLIMNVLITVILYSIIGVVVGYYIDKNNLEATRK